MLVLGGSGRVGFTLLSLLTRHYNCLVTTTASPNNHEKLVSLGIPTEMIVDHARITTQPGDYDVIFDTQGTPQTETVSIPLLKTGGTYITFNGSLVRRADSQGFTCGMVQGLRESLNKGAELRSAKGLHFGYALFAPDGEALNKLMKMAEKDELVSDVGKVFSLESLPQAFDFCFHKGASGKVIIDVNK